MPRGRKRAATRRSAGSESDDAAAGHGAGAGAGGSSDALDLADTDTHEVLWMLEHCCAQRYTGAISHMSDILRRRGVTLDEGSALGQRILFSTLDWQFRLDAHAIDFDSLLSSFDVALRSSLKQVDEDDLLESYYAKTYVGACVQAVLTTLRAGFSYDGDDGAVSDAYEADKADPNAVVMEVAYNSHSEGKIVRAEEVLVLNEERAGMFSEAIGVFMRAIPDHLADSDMALAMETSEEELRECLASKSSGRRKNAAAKLSIKQDKLEALIRDREMSWDAFRDRARLGLADVEEEMLGPSQLARAALAASSRKPKPVKLQQFVFSVLDSAGDDAGAPDFDDGAFAVDEVDEALPRMAPQQQAETARRAALQAYQALHPDADPQAFLDALASGVAGSLGAAPTSSGAGAGDEVEVDLSDGDGGDDGDIGLSAVSPPPRATRARSRPEVAADAKRPPTRARSTQSRSKEKTAGAADEDIDVSVAVKRGPTKSPTKATNAPALNSQDIADDYDAFDLFAAGEVEIGGGVATQAPEIQAEPSQDVERASPQPASPAKRAARAARPLRARGAAATRRSRPVESDSGESESSGDESGEESGSDVRRTVRASVPSPPKRPRRASRATGGATPAQVKMARAKARMHETAQQMPDPLEDMGLAPVDADEPAAAERSFDGGGGGGAGAAAAKPPTRSRLKLGPTATKVRSSTRHFLCCVV